MSNVHIVNLSRYTQPAINISGREEWVEYGDSNDYYDFLIKAYRNSPTHNAIVNNVAKLMYGGGLTARNAKLRPEDWARAVSMIKPADLRASILDYKLFGNGAFQIIYTKGKVAKIAHIPQNLLRPEKCNEEGDIEAYYYSDNWDDVKKFPPKRIPVFGTSKDEVEVLVYGNYGVDRKYFAAPDYEGCIDYAVLEEEVATYLINDVKNGFSGTKVINFNDGKPTPQEQEKIVHQVKSKLTGAGGDKVIISFNHDEATKTTVDDIPLNDAPDHYNYLATESRNKILVGHNVTSPMLVGISPDGQGFSSNADEINVASQYFYNTVIQPLQQPILEALESILAVNGISLELFFKRLNPMGDLVEEKPVQMAEEVEVDELMFDSLQDAPLGDEWVCVYSAPVDYETEDEIDATLADMNEPETPNFMQKLVSLVSTGTARPNAKSGQDTDKFKSRYRYTGTVKENSRAFCKKMIQANKIYRKEDIMQMASIAVNEGWGANGADTYDIWLYKGGGNCGHHWNREIYARRSDVNSPNAERFSPRDVAAEGEKLERNDNKVKMKPRDMPNNGFLNPR